MVNTLKNISAYQGEPTGRNDKISGGPLYDKMQILALLDDRGGLGISAWTEKCIDDVADLGFDADGNKGLAELIRYALMHGRYRDSEWCLQKPSGPWVAADAYDLTRSEWIDAAYKELPISYFVKFAVAKTGQLLLIVSCHT